MPLYVYKCPNCESTDEVIQQLGTTELTCSGCGCSMSKQPTTYAFVYMKGYPSFRKQYLGTAPYTSGGAMPKGVKGGPGSKMPEAKIEGEKWLESIE